MMAQPSRTLWCAFSDVLDEPFPIDCTLDVDTIGHVKDKIFTKNQRKVGQIDPRQLKLYSPASLVEDPLTKENLADLHPRQRISSDFPQSNDPAIDIIILQPTELNERAPDGCTSLGKSSKGILPTIQQAFPQGMDAIADFIC